MTCKCIELSADIGRTPRLIAQAGILIVCDAAEMVAVIEQKLIGNPDRQCITWIGLA